ncbi:hypothetical protein BN903_2 [Halorubrum sp. AJ67]|nr:hypothetical protein BN903_2 [Halorubrum sp. AJ67]
MTVDAVEVTPVGERNPDSRHLPSEVVREWAGHTRQERLRALK